MTGNKMLDNIIMGLALLTSGATLAIFIYADVIFEKPLPSNSVEEQALMNDVEKAVFTEAFKLDKLILNLKSQTSRLRFLEVETFLVPFQTKQQEILEENKAIISDIIIDEASRIAPNELNTVSGKLIFENRIKTTINRRLHKKIVKEIFFSRFVVQ